MAMLGLGLALIVATRTNMALEKELTVLRELVGFDSLDRGNDSFLVSTVGSTPINDYGTHLLRIESFEDYWLEISFYDGSTTKRKRTLVEIGDPIIAISYFDPGRSGSAEFFVQSTYGMNQKTFHQFRFSPHSNAAAFSGGAQGGIIPEECIFHYLFWKPELHPTGPNENEVGPRPTVARIEELCDRYRIQTVTFRLEPKTGE